MKANSCLRLTGLFLLLCNAGLGQKGKDGAKTYSAAGTYILNRYTSLASSAVAGATSITVSNITDLSGATSFTNSVNPYPTNALTVGDLILIVQVQGATIGTSNTNSYGTVATYNNTGNFELKYVLGVAGNVINFCTGLANSYTEGGTARTEVIRVPRLSSLTVGAGVTLTGSSWSATTGTGGVVALEVSGDITLNGSISADAIGFSGGTDPLIGSSSNPGSGVITVYRTTATNNSGGKGESIAGNAADYAALLGANGRGAPANGGGGGNGHNCGGGGGSNAGASGALTPYNGTGLKDISTASWASAWNLEAAGFATDVSVGGGRGGYSYFAADQDALTVGTSNSSWGGDYRDNEGGLGGHPLSYNGDTRLFMGGGGGAGDGNNNGPGDGGNGGGIAYILCNGNVSGNGTLTANGQNGYPTYGSIKDASGGAGGGGAIQALVSGSIIGIGILANGGAGGSQPFIANEGEGPGGGGGGGYIATTTTLLVPQVNGGANGTSASAYTTEFLPDGATKGNAGTSVVKTFADVEDCAVLLSRPFISFAAMPDTAMVELTWETGDGIGTRHFTIERSTDAVSFVAIGTLDATVEPAASHYRFNDANLPANTSIFFYRIKLTGADSRYTYSSILRADITGRNRLLLAVSPNPVREYVQVSYVATEAGSINAGIINAQGAVVRSINMHVGKGVNNFIVNELNRLAPGQYILMVRSSREVLSKTFMVTR